MSDLADKECVPCKGGVPPLPAEAVRELLTRLGGGWGAAGAHHLEKEFRFKNFREALAFANRAGEVAEAQKHHPDLHVSWGKVNVEIFTHKIGGLTESDFVLAAKIDRVAAP